MSGLNQGYGITIDDLQEIGKSPVVKHRFTMCCRMGTIAYRWDINNLVGNGSELQVVLFIPEISFKSSGLVTRSNDIK